MKIVLERKLKFCPNHLRCIVCCQLFEVGRIRSILYNDQRLIQGDICSECLKLSAEEIKQNMREYAMLLMEKPELCNSPTRSHHELALELLESSTEELKLPNFFQWLIKKLQVFSQSSQELEVARWRLLKDTCGRRSRPVQQKERSRLQIFDEDEE